MAFAKLLAGVALSGVLLVLALPLGEQAYLAWFALVPLLRAVHGRGVLLGFIGALATIFFAAWLATKGVFYAHKDFEGEVGWIYTGMGLFGFAVALTTAVWADKSTDAKPLWWFAALAVLLEACLLLQLPAHLALTQYRQPVPLMIASVGGIWAVSFLVWLTNLWLARLVWQRLAWVVPLVAGLSLALGGAWLPSRGALRSYAAIQTEATDDVALFDLHIGASMEHATLVVWPEFSALAIAALDTSSLKTLARGEGVAPFVTTFRDDHKPLPHNVAALFSSRGESERYFKRKPFGAEKQMHAAGTRAVAAKLGQGAVGLNICFDSCFPGVMRDTTRLPGVDVIALPTIDPQAPHHFLAAMHAAYSPFRAAELGTPIVRSDGLAYSSIVDARGHIAAEAPPGEQVLIAAVPPGPRFTLYRTLGDWFLYACAAAFLLGLRRKSPM